MLNYIRESLLKHYFRMVGTFWNDEDIYIVHIEKNEEKWFIKEAVSEKLNAWQATGGTADPVGRIKMYCTKRGLSLDSIGAAASGKMAFSYEKSFPLPLPIENKLDDMLRLDLLVNAPYDKDDWWWMKEQLDADGRFFLAAMESEFGEAFVSRFENAGIRLSTMVIEKDDYPFSQGDGYIELLGTKFEIADSVQNITWNHGMMTALWAAVSAVIFNSCGLLPENKCLAQIAWKKIELCCVVGVLMFLSLLFLGNCYKLYSIENMIAEQRERLVMTAEEREKMKSRIKAEQAIMQADSVMINLTEKRSSYYNILLQLGMVSIDDLYITELSVNDNGSVVIIGKSNNYEAISTFVDFVKEEKIFPNDLHLEKSEINKQNEIAFVLKGDNK